MNVAPFADMSRRRAALLVHAMPPGDQAWLLQSLSAAHRETLQALLDDLGALGIPADAKLLESVTQAPVEPAAPPTAMQRLQALGAPCVPVLARLLRDEPPQLAQRLLAAGAWPWREALLAQLGPAFVQRMEAAPAAPALDAFLLEAVATHVAALPAPVAARRPAWARLWQRRSAR